MSAIKSSEGQRNGELVRDAATNEVSEILQRLNSSPAGLSEDEAAERLEVFGPNEVGQEKKHDWLWRFWVAVRNPLVILLTLLAIFSFFTYFHAKPEDKDV